jgi:hypothetical protein
VDGGSGCGEAGDGVGEFLLGCGDVAVCHWSPFRMLLCRTQTVDCGANLAVIFP